MNGWKKVYASQSIIDAELIKNELLSHEISAVVINKKDSNYLFGYCEVYVAEHDENLANVVIEHLQTNESNDI